MYHTLRSSSVGELSGRDAVPLDDLVSVIETLKARLQTHRQALQANETRTRMALIDPLLQALGWDTADPALVLPEYDLRGNRADYALLDSTGKPVALVEAKRLGEQLASHRMQIVNYANMSGVPYAGLTDGNHWELYKVFDPAPIEDRLLLNISIADLPVHEVALKLLLLWRPNLAAGQPAAANEPVLTTVTKPVIETPPAPPREPVTAQPAVAPEVQEPPAPALARASELPPATAGWVPLSESPHPTIGNRPTAIRFPDESTCEMKYWNRLLEPIIKWLWSNKLLTMSKIPVYSDERTHIVNTDGYNPSGSQFRRPQPVAGTPLKFEADIDAKQAVNRARKLLQECGVSEAEVRLQVGEG